MEADVKRLDRICRDLADVEIGLMEGTIDFSYDKLMCAMKPGHPCEIMDGILANIYYPAMRGQEPPMDVIEGTLKQLQSFGQDFGIKEIKAPLKKLAEYVKDRKRNVESALPETAGQQVVDYMAVSKAWKEERGWMDNSKTVV